MEEWFSSNYTSQEKKIKFLFFDNSPKHLPDEDILLAVSDYGKKVEARLAYGSPHRNVTITEDTSPSDCSHSVVRIGYDLEKKHLLGEVVFFGSPKGKTFKSILSIPELMANLALSSEVRWYKDGEVLKINQIIINFSSRIEGKKAEEIIQEFYDSQKSEVE